MPNEFSQRVCFDSFKPNKQTRPKAHFRAYFLEQTTDKQPQRFMAFLSGYMTNRVVQVSRYYGRYKEAL
jgi:hypothetical protein